jgi:hypothetical protein
LATRRSKRLDAKWLSVLYSDLDIGDAKAVAEKSSLITKIVFRERPLVNDLESCRPELFPQQEILRETITTLK